MKDILDGALGFFVVLGVFFGAACVLVLFADLLVWVAWGDWMVSPVRLIVGLLCSFGIILVLSAISWLEDYFTK